MKASQAAATASGFLGDRTVHLHPVARCNLACAHCYSSSSPRAQAELPVDVLRRGLAVLRGEGYEILSLSGGEPLLYGELEALLRHARDLGFRVLGVSNGYRVRAEFQHLVAGFDGLAVSFDGSAAVHDRVRGRKGAFARAVGALEYLQQIGMPAAAAYVVSKESLGYAPEFAELAHGLGVRALQLRPLVLAGRAREAYAHAALSPIDLTRTWLIGAALARAYQGRMRVHTDLAHSRTIEQSVGAYAGLLEGDLDRPLSDRVNPLVVTPDGILRPLTYDFPSTYDLCRLHELDAVRLAQVRRRSVPALADVVRRALRRVVASQSFVDWFAVCRDVAAGADAGEADRFSLDERCLSG